MTLTFRDYAEASEKLGCELAVIKAVAQVECPHPGFFKDGQVRILFEAHKFSQFTNGKYDDTHPNISSPHWNPKLYSGGSAEHKRLQIAVKLNREAALKSASWGKFQIMGFNFKQAGFDELQDFINAMHRSERAQLDAFVNFIINEGLAPLLRGKKWSQFARRYNGPAYATHKYHIRLEQAYKALLN